MRRPRTRLVTGGRDRARDFDFINPPLVRGSTVLHADVADMRNRTRRRAAGDDAAINYGMYGTPTHHALYAALCDLERGHRCWAVPSGLAACTLSILAFVGNGDHLLLPDSVYWPTRRFCCDTLPRFGVESTFYDPRAGSEIEELFRPATRVLFLESPGSHTFEMQDVALLASIARRRGATSIMDNTWATPLFFQPLAHGVDVSLQAVTKYIGGHSDLILGTIACNESAWTPLREMLLNYGMYVSPDDCWLALRGLRSLAARLAQHRANAERLIAWLKQRREVERILYPADPDDPGYALWKRDMSGASGLFSVALKAGTDADRFTAFIDALKLFGRGYSWGGYESLLIPIAPERTVVPLPFKGPMFRISAGLEDVEDLIEDLDAGFARLRG